MSRGAEVAAIREALPSLAATVVLPYLRTDASGVDGAMTWDELTADEGDLRFEPVPFDHPLFVLYSSGTTGLPKPIVHGHGGILLEHLKIHALHHDLGPADRFFWFSTTGWMMWNYLVSGLAVDASIVLYDGSPAHPDLGALWQLAADEGVTYFGASAPYLMACRKEGLRPGELADLSQLRAIGSTGSPLPAEGFRYVYEAISPSVHLQSVSGGTDVCTAFVGASPLVPVWEGEISCRHLGCAVEAFDPEGRPLVGEQGELVITRPMPSMPVGFWNDPDGSRYRAAYFDDFPGVWRHGDWITFTDRGSCVISGRSDATLNRGGVRVGTAEFYAVVEGLPEIADSLVVHLDAGDRLLLFVAIRDGGSLTDALRARIGAELRSALSPRHVPGRDPRRPRHPAHAVRQEARGAGQADPHRDAGRRGGVARLARRSNLARSVRGARPDHVLTVARARRTMAAWPTTSCTPGSCGTPERARPASHWRALASTRTTWSGRTRSRGRSQSPCARATTASSRAGRASRARRATSR